MKEMGVKEVRKGEEKEVEKVVVKEVVGRVGEVKVVVGGVGVEWVE